MINVFILGLTALAGITGFTSGTTYPKQYNEFANMASAINQRVIEKNGELLISNTTYCNELYTISGENRYYELSWPNGYLIYDRKDDEIDEISFNKTSPYIDYQSDFKIYNEGIFDFKYVTYNIGKNAFVDILNNEVINNKVSVYYETNCSVDAGNYYQNIHPSSDAHFSKNSFYFENLNGMHAWNSLGTCSVISTEMLLGYYDTFVNDNIVSENYDCVTHQYITTNKLTDFTQSPRCDDHANGVSAFHDMLVSIGRDEVGDDPEVDGMTTINQIKMIKKYLEKNNLNYSISSSEGNLSDIWNQRAVSIIKNGIDSGRPVIANGTGHSTVAYAYDSKYVYVHTGWGWIGATPWSTYESGIFYNYSAGCIDLKFETELGHCHSNNYYSSATNNYICPCGAMHQEILLTPKDYGFESQYYFTKKSNTINFGNLIINTERLRTGYIEGEYVNLSPRRADAGDAYLEYSFSKSIERLSFSLSFWSSSERLFKSDSYVYFQIKDSFGNWTTYIDFLNDVNLSKDRSNQDKFDFIFGTQDVYGIRFISHSSAVGDRNKGRICIGDMNILHNA